MNNLQVKMTATKTIAKLKTFIKTPFSGYKLTGAEEEAANLLAKGLTIKQVAGLLGITTASLYERLSGFTRKTGIKHKDIYSYVRRNIDEILGE